MDDIEFDELNENSIKSLNSILNTINNKIDNDNISVLTNDINKLNYNNIMEKEEVDNNE